MSDINLPEIIPSSLRSLEQLTTALSVPRSILASDEEISEAWTRLPRLLKQVPPDLRTEGLARMCVAVASGLFDSAINYVWNATIIELREKVKRFGLSVVQQIRQDPNFDEEKLLELQDAKLLDLCLKLNLITEDGYFKLDQCRDIRNNFSAAHPTVGDLDDHEFLNFTNRCIKNVLIDKTDHVGVDIQAFLGALKGSKFSSDQKTQWVSRIERTHEAQQLLLFGTLHGIYCDPQSGEETRVNSLGILEHFSSTFSPSAKSDFINKHSDYMAKGDRKRHTASRQLFEKLEILSLLDAHEQHSLISNACRKLTEVHYALNNFYNEPPFAERLLGLSQQFEIPDTVKEEFVESVMICGIGNQYGVSNAAQPYIEKIIKSFSPHEVELLFNLEKKKGVVSRRLRAHNSCRRHFKAIVDEIDESTVPTKYKERYQELIA